ncbi:MAG TPA: nitroreductase family deazaflavin-dependent oxidoreductase [Ktedonobacterales bacterium]
MGEDIAALLARAEGEENCYLTTTGRVSGQPHEIEIWFGVHATNLYFLSGGGEDADWVKNLRATPAATVRIGTVTVRGVGRIVTDADEDTLARRLLAAKYERWREGRPLSSWARIALPVALDIAVTR